MNKSEIKKQRFWNSFAHKYDKFISNHTGTTYSNILDLIKKELRKDYFVLEVATGSGNISLSIHDLVQQINAIDFAEEMVETARNKQQLQNAENIVFETGNAFELAYPDETFDMVIASNVFHLLKNPELASSEIYRVLKESGKAIFPTFCHGENFKSKTLSLFMSLSGFKAENRWSTQNFSNFIVKQNFIILKEIIIEDKIPLSFIVVSKK